MQTIDLTAEKRNTKTKGSLRELRVSGNVPAVVYGGSKEPERLVVNLKNFIHLLKGHGVNVLMNLKVSGGAEVVLVKDVQRDVLSHEVIHVDFQRISMDKKLEVAVPLHIVGEAPGVKVGGGILEHILRNLKVRCLPSDIPDHVSVDVGQLQINQGIKVKDLVLPSGVEALADREGLVINIVAPTEEEAAPAAAAAAPGAAEPEVIAKGKKPEEGEEGAAKAPAAAKGAAPAAGAKAAAPAAGAKEKK